MLLPYVATPKPIHVAGPLELPAFGILVATGVMIGSLLAIRRAVRRGLSRAKMESLASYILIFGFVLSHVLDVLMYRPRDVLRDPLELVKLGNGISSYGGFVGCAVGVLVWKYVKKEKVMPYGDQISAIFPIGWIFGRAGCALAHDHIGRISDSPLAVEFPPGIFYPPGARFDLGLLELFFTIPIALIVWWFARKPRRAGAITGLLCVLYAPVRFPLDALRATDIINADARYFGLTPAQWLSIALFAVGVQLLLRSRTQPMIGREITTASPTSPSAPASA